MNKKVNFEDNFFILAMRIRVIQDTLTLDAEPELFLEKLLDDIYFIDHTLRVLLGYLEDSRHLLEKDEILDQFFNVENQFSRVLGELLDHEENLSVQEIPSLGEKLQTVKRGSLDRQRTIGKIDSEEDDDLDTVSSRELTELLKAL